MSPDLDVAVVGAGIAGLAAARELHAAGHSVAVLEAGERPGGVIESVAREGFLWERGPSAFRVPPVALGFLRRHGLEAALQAAGPEARQRFLYLDGRLEPVPDGPLALLRSPLLSAAGKRRALAEPFAAPAPPRDESVAEFVTRRFGREVLERAVAPFLIGVYAGDPRALGAEAVFPALVAHERESGSVLGGLARGALRRGGPRGLSGSWSARGGLAGLVRALAEPLAENLELAAPVSRIEPDERGWRLEHARGALEARAVLLAVPSAAAAALLRPLDVEAATLADAIDWAPLAVLALDVDPARCAQPIRGFGMLVPEQAGLELLGALFMSRVFPSRAPAGRELLTAMLGGRRSPDALDRSDEKLLDAASAGLRASLGLRAEPRLLDVARWPRAVAQPAPGHLARTRELRARLVRLPGLRLAGGWLDGVALGAALVSGVRAAAQLRSDLASASPQQASMRRANPSTKAG